MNLTDLSKSVLRRVHARLGAEHGFTMVVALGVLTVTSLLVAATFIALQGQTQLAASNLSSKRAYSAAQAGVNAFLYNMNQNPSYWQTCANDTVPVTPVPGATDNESYSYSPIWANGNSGCTSNIINSLVDTATGTIRIVFMGYAGNRPQIERGIVVSFRMNSPLDFLWYTHFEAFDPAIPGMTGCNVFYRQGRNSNCNINWFSRDVMNGPMYTDDQYLIGSGSQPTFGRNANDRIESSEPKTPTSPQDICSGYNCGSAVFHGTQIPDATPIPTPSDNSELLTDAQSYGKVYTGTTTIFLNGTTATVTNCPTTSCTTSTVNISQYPIIYVSNGSGCTTPVYDPTNVTYQSSGGNYYGCTGDVYVSGSYSTPLTIGAADDVIVNSQPSFTGGPGIVTSSDGSGNPTGVATLGLVANQYIRVMHGCTGGNNVASQTMSNPTIDAAMLALDHSFMLDNYGCGTSPGNLNIHGAIAQYYRGAVSTGSGSPSTGYAKNYNYDDRLATLLPPYLFDISNSGWHISRETICVPPGQGSNQTTICT